MEIIAINGSPRKKWNTATILQHVLDGAAGARDDVRTEMLHLYDFTYRGCLSCFECKRLGGPSYGKCAVKDELQPVLERVLHADALVFGSPIYFSDMTGEMRSFLERLLFPGLAYDKAGSSLAPKKLLPVFVYTMGVPKNLMAEWQYPEFLRMTETFASRIFGHKARALYVNYTWQFKDYARYETSVFDVADKQKYREEQFPEDCKAALRLGSEIAASLAPDGQTAGA